VHFSKSSALSALVQQYLTFAILSNRPLKYRVSKEHLISSISKRAQSSDFSILTPTTTVSENSSQMALALPIWFVNGTTYRRPATQAQALVLFSTVEEWCFPQCVEFINFRFPWQQFMTRDSTYHVREQNKQCHPCII
jgi:hypothetical protein